MTTSPQIIEVYVSNTPAIIEVNVPGATGPQGEPGLSTIGGYGISVSNLESGDLLRFTGLDWGNKNENEITDGGNY